MNFIEQPSDTGIQIDIQLEDFEEAVLANAVVTAALGEKAEDHHLLLPHDHTYGTSLVDAIELSTQPDANPIIFSGEAKDIIVGALGIAADKNSGSPNQVKAAMMLGYADNQPKQKASLLSPKPKIPRVRSYADIAKRIPTNSRTFHLKRRVALCGFGDMVAAQHAVAEFVGDDSVLLEKGREAKDGLPSLVDAINQTDPQKSEIWTFDGKDARTLRRALKKAAARDETVYDAAAAHILETEIVIPELAPAKAHRRAPVERSRLLGVLALQR